MPSETRPGTDAAVNRWNATSESSLNEIFRVCAARVRRETLVVLRTEDDPISLTELATELSDDTEQVRLSLVHIHLPMLDAAGLVRWNPKRDSVALDAIPSRYRRLIDVIDREMR
ncbi:DUF7344 domain-containing protein [Haladaptatus caseinilyticus]|uniref:DUF7344 domain-containing protein n=1 Tax=Haladaptatus caseinilyticus TaxID=2993314 RepID=UPI00224B201F|nr:ArsR family transcriptional regulator [Haladaptatus caseinilyticus]